MHKVVENHNGCNRYPHDHLYLFEMWKTLLEHLYSVLSLYKLRNGKTHSSPGGIHNLHLPAPPPLPPEPCLATVIGYHDKETP